MYYGHNKPRSIDIRNRVKLPANLIEALEVNRIILPAKYDVFGDKKSNLSLSMINMFGGYIADKCIYILPETQCGFLCAEIYDPSARRFFESYPKETLNIDELERLEQLLDAEKITLDKLNRFIIPLEISKYLHIGKRDKVVFEGWGTTIGMFKSDTYKKYFYASLNENLED